MESLIHSKQHNPLKTYTHIILDEVHERDKDMDFLMIAIYKYLNPNIRIILMSATIDVNKVIQLMIINIQPEKLITFFFDSLLNIMKSP